METDGKLEQQKTALFDHSTSFHSPYYSILGFAKTPNQTQENSHPLLMSQLCLLLKASHHPVLVQSQIRLTRLSGAAMARISEHANGARRSLLLEKRVGVPDARPCDRAFADSLRDQ
ncbi:MAG: hypothetical protein OXP66_04920 [Candidatus Tectomicrobia bacterium]|nr:hypothetical protein [Candidatus Tectomicrobia bacterium]